jgi:hypothetical protein
MTEKKSALKGDTSQVRKRKREDDPEDEKEVAKIRKRNAEVFTRLMGWPTRSTLALGEPTKPGEEDDETEAMDADDD